MSDPWEIYPFERVLNLIRGNLWENALSSTSPSPVAQHLEKDRFRRMNICHRMEALKRGWVESLRSVPDSPR
jgi:hypothetical protein